MKLKPWQLVVVVCVIVAGVAGIVYTFASSDSDHVNTVIHCVDVETGDIYRIDVNKTPVVIPARNPTTHKVALLRLSKSPSGEWIVNPRDLSGLGQLDEGVVNKVVDPETGHLTGAAKTPVDYVRSK